MADYMNMTNHSIFHVIDRFMALTNLILETSKVITMGFYVRPSTFYLQVCILITCVICFMNSSHCQHERDGEGFVFWHNLWHTYPLLSIAVLFYDRYIANSIGQFEVIISPTKSAENVSKLVKKIS